MTPSDKPAFSLAGATGFSSLIPSHWEHMVHNKSIDSIFRCYQVSKRHTATKNERISGFLSIKNYITTSDGLTLGRTLGWGCLKNLPTIPAHNILPRWALYRRVGCAAFPVYPLKSLLHLACLDWGKRLDFLAPMVAQVQYTSFLKLGHSRNRSTCCPSLKGQFWERCEQRGTIAFSSGYCTAGGQRGQAN